MRVFSLGAALAIGLAMPAAAQDIAPAMNPADIGWGILVSNIPRQGQPSVTTPKRAAADKQDVSARARATCRNKGQAAANYGRDHPKVRELYRLCAIAGY